LPPLLTEQRPCPRPMLPIGALLWFLMCCSCMYHSFPSKPPPSLENKLGEHQ
jgi:hypothetical protein